MSTSPYELTCEILSRRSITPNDAGCQDKIVQVLEPLGFKAERIHRNDTQNLWIRKGEEGPLFIFAGHTDVVPSGDESLWDSPAFTPTIRDGRLYARGVADMKTSIACFTCAVERFIKDHPNHRGSIALLLTSDEEGDGYDGTTFVVDTLASRNIQPRWCIVGEPSCSRLLGDAIKNGRRGSLNGKLTVRGIQGHVAYPEKVSNPIHPAGQIVSELATTTWGKTYPGFPMTSFQVSNIHAGTGAVNVVPADCTVTFNIRFNPSLTAEALIQQIEGICAKYTSNYSIEWKISATPFATKGEELSKALSQAITKVCGIKPEFSTSGGTSDARFISRWCPEVVEFGPTNETIHKINENIPVDQIDKLTDIYYKTLETLLAS